MERNASQQLEKDIWRWRTGGVKIGKREGHDMASHQQTRAAFKNRLRQHGDRQTDMACMSIRLPGWLSLSSIQPGVVAGLSGATAACHQQADMASTIFSMPEYLSTPGWLGAALVHGSAAWHLRLLPDPAFSSGKTMEAKALLFCV